MIENVLKKRWASGQPTINGWLSIGSPMTAEIMAAQGFDSLTVDIQHGALDYRDMLAMFQAMRASGVVPMARVPWLEPGAIMKALDGGAYGIICPMVNTAEQAAALVSYMRYPPQGTRSFGPTRANFSAGPGYFAAANNETLCLAMIETAQAMENLEAIVNTPGLSGIYVGPADLTLGVTNGRLPPGFDRTEPEMVEVIRRIVEAAKKAGIIAGIHCGAPAYAKQAIDWGYSMVTLNNDVSLIASGAQKSLGEMRSLLGHDGPQTGQKSSY